MTRALTKAGFDPSEPRSGGRWVVATQDQRHRVDDKPKKKPTAQDLKDEAIQLAQTAAHLASSPTGKNPKRATTTRQAVRDAVRRELGIPKGKAFKRLTPARQQLATDALSAAQSGATARAQATQAQRHIDQIRAELDKPGLMAASSRYLSEQLTRAQSRLADANRREVAAKQDLAAAKRAWRVKKSVDSDVSKVAHHVPGTPFKYTHGWKLIGEPSRGTRVHHPEHGHGTVAGRTPKRTQVEFESGLRHTFEHGGTASALEPLKSTEGHTASRHDELAAHHATALSLRSGKRPDRGKVPGSSWHAHQEQMQQHREQIFHHQTMANEVRRAENARTGPHFARRAETAKPRTPRKAATPKVPKLVESPSDVAAKLDAATTREEGAAALEGKTVKELRAVSDAAGVAYGSKYTKDQLRHNLVHHTVGRRLDSAAIRGDNRPSPAHIRDKKIIVDAKAELAKLDGEAETWRTQRVRPTPAESTAHQIAETRARDRLRAAETRMLATEPYPTNLTSSGVIDAESIARLRQARIDVARSVAETLARVDEYRASEASPRAMEHRIRGQGYQHGHPPELIDELLAAGTDGEQINRTLDRIATSHGLTRHSKPSGGVERYDRNRHAPIGSEPVGGSVRILRPGYHATIDSAGGGKESVMVSRADVQESGPAMVAALGVSKPDSGVPSWRNVEHSLSLSSEANRYGVNSDARRALMDASERVKAGQSLDAALEDLVNRSEHPTLSTKDRNSLRASIAALRNANSTTVRPMKPFIDESVPLRGDPEGDNMRMHRNSLTMGVAQDYAKAGRNGSANEMMDLRRRATTSGPDGIRPQQVVNELKAMRAREQDPVFQRRLDRAIAGIDAPTTPMPALPANTPPAARKLMEDLHAIPYARKGKGEPVSSGSIRGASLVDQLVEVYRDVAAGRRGDDGRSPSDRIHDILRNRTHESNEAAFRIWGLTHLLESKGGKPSPLTQELRLWERGQLPQP